jgi:hypothetical protein
MTKLLKYCCVVFREVVLGSDQQQQELGDLVCVERIDGSWMDVFEAAVCPSTGCMFEIKTISVPRTDTYVFAR